MRPFALRAIPCGSLPDPCLSFTKTRVFHTGSVGGVEGGHAEASLGGAQHHEGVPAMVVVIIIIMMIIITTLVPTLACWAV